ncbi:MAG: hypothetical protein D6679_11020 [Candidatus Hydrogenedentota bacterium]|nr:MAG: hypothetical protein D6679_11020 [Candidatus Hydrogenedentota bacterium]
MRDFLQTMGRRPIVVLILMLALTLAGIGSADQMPVGLFPDLNVPLVNIITHLPGASAENIEFLVSRPIESQMQSIPGVQRVSSVSAEGISRVTIQFAWGTRVQDAWMIVQARLARLRSLLPQGATPRLENIGTTLQEVCDYVVYGVDDPVALTNLVRYKIAGRINEVPGVASVDVIGGEERAFFVRVRPEALDAARLSIPNLVRTLQKYNSLESAGYYEDAGREYRIRAEGRIRTIEDLKHLALSDRDGTSVPLSAVATLSEGVRPKHYTVTGNGHPAVALLVRKQPSANTTDVVAAVDKFLSENRSLFPHGTIVQKYYDQSEIVHESQHEILEDMVLGAGIAIAVLAFFLGAFRPTLIVVITIPLTLLGTIVIMRFFGLSFNVITMSALVLSIGMIVDDTIVVAENIHRHSSKGLSPIDAAWRGTVEIAAADTAGTVTTAAAFLPLVFITGIFGLFLKPFGVTISSALMISLLFSLTLVPILFCRLPVAQRLPRESRAGEHVLRLLQEPLLSLLDFCFDHRKVVVGAAALGGVAGVLCSLGMNVAVLPPIDEGGILVEYTLPPGTSLTQSNRLGAELVKTVLSDPAVACVFRMSGSPEGGFQIEGVNLGEILIKLKKRTLRRRSADDVIRTLRKSFDGLEGAVLVYHQPTQEKMDESFSGLPAVFGVTIYGDDEEELEKIAGQVEKIMAADPAISNIVNNTKFKASQVDVRIDPAKLERFHLEPEDVFQTLKAAHQDLVATSIIKPRETVSVIVTLDHNSATAGSDLVNLPIGTYQGTLVPLSAVASISRRKTPSALHRLNGQRELTLIAEVEGNIPSVAAHLKKSFRTLSLPSGYSISISGQYKVLMRSALDLVLLLAGAILLIYFILVLQTGSGMRPILILVTVPTALTGAVVALRLFNQALDVSVALGVITLVGVAVNNAIVLLDFADRSLVRLEMQHGNAAGGLDRTLRINAFKEAVSIRLRPILLTSLTTIGALIPAALALHTGSHIFQPFAITVIGGLTTSLFATLILIPTLAI